MRAPLALWLLLAVVLLAGVATFAGGRAAAAAWTPEVEPNDDAGNATVLPYNGSGQGEAGTDEVDYWSLTLPNGGWALLDIHSTNGRTDLTNMTLENAGAGCTRHPFSQPGKVVLNASAGAPCALRVNATADNITYYLSVTVGNTSSELSQTSGEVEPDEATPNERRIGDPVGWEGWVDPELDPVDTWAVSAPEGVQMVDVRILSMRGTGEFTVEVLSGGITFQQTELMGGGSWFTAKYLTPPANRTIVFAIHATDAPSNYGLSFSSQNMTLEAPPVPSVKELERSMLHSWTFVPHEDGRSDPPDFEALSQGGGIVYGGALCVVSQLSNDAFDMRVLQGRYFGVLHGAGNGFVSARTQIVHLPRDEPACFDVLSQSTLWRHDGPGSDYFISGVYYETVTNRNVTELVALFDALTQAGEAGPAAQLAFWSIDAGMNRTTAVEMGASNATVTDAIALLDGQHISTRLNNPPEPPVTQAEDEGGQVSATLVMGVVGAVVAAGAALWVWDPPFLHRGRRRER